MALKPEVYCQINRKNYIHLLVFPSVHQYFMLTVHFNNVLDTLQELPGLVGQFDACATGNQEVAASMLHFGTILTLRLIMKSFL